MRAMVLREYGQPLTLEEIERPSFGAKEVLLKVKAAGVCGTDLKIRAGSVLTKELPFIPGHEVAGVVEEVGAEVKDFSKGDEVLVSFYIPCNSCGFCLSGRQTICEKLQGRIGFEFNGGFAEYVVVPEDCLIAKPSSLTFPEASIIADALGTCYHALVKRANVKEGDYLLLLGGGGGLGLHALQIGLWLGANVIGVDVTPEKKALMQAYGANLVVDGSEPNWSEKVLEYTEGRGAQHALNFFYQRESIAEGLKSLGKGGQLVAVAYSSEFTFDAFWAHLHEIDLLATRAASKDDVEKCLELVVSGRVEPIIGEILRLEELNEGLDMIAAGRVKGRVVLSLE